MKILNSVYNYGGYSFNIKVELFHKVEKQPNGKKWHKITINDLGQTSNFYKSIEDVESIDLIPKIELLKVEAQDFVDKRNPPQTEEEKILNKNGFV